MTAGEGLRPEPAVISDTTVERLLESQRVAIQQRARNAMDAITEVIADENRVKVYGLTYSQYEVLRDARDGLRRVLP